MVVLCECATKFPVFSNLSKSRPVLSHGHLVSRLTGSFQIFDNKKLTFNEIGINWKILAILFKEFLGSWIVRKFLEFCRIPHIQSQEVRTCRVDNQQSLSKIFLFLLLSLCILVVVGGGELEKDNWFKNEVYNMVLSIHIPQNHLRKYVKTVSYEAISVEIP